MRLYDYAASGNCYKVRLALAQLEVAYERVPIDIFAGETMTDAYRRKNPSAQTPLLEFDDGSFLPESNAILLYVADGTSLVPSDRGACAQTWRWLFWERSRLAPTVATLRFLVMTNRIESARELDERHSACRAALDLLDQHLSREEFVAGRYSVADISLFAYAHVTEDAGVSLTPYVNVRRWLEAVTRQPRFINDLVPYPPNALRGAGVSLYD